MLNRLKQIFVLYGTHVIIIVFLVAAGAISFLAQFWLKKENMNISAATRNTYAILAGIGTGLLGYLANLLVSRQKDVNMSKSEILEKLQKNLAVNPIHKKKLDELAKESLLIWRQLLAVPEAGRKLTSRFFMDSSRLARQYVRINTDAPIMATRCPSVHEEIVLFFNTYEISHGVINMDSSDAIGTVLSKHIALLNEKAPQSAMLFKILSHNQLEKNIRIWVKVPNYTISAIHQVDDVLNTVSGVFKNIFNDFQLTLELYVATDMNVEQTEMTIDPKDKTLLEGNRLPAHQYTVQRNVAYERLAGQRIFGKPDLPVLQIPVTLMEGRLRELQRGTMEGWKSIVISGSPGTGKTELAHLFIQEYSHRSNDYLLYCNCTEVYQMLQNPDTYQSLFHFLNPMADFMASQDSIGNLANAYPMPAYEASPYKDALLNRLNKGLNKIVLIVDDLESNSDLKDTLIRKHDLLTSWGVKIILISRSEMPSINASFKINLALWTQQEAISILSEWNPSIDIHDISLQRYISENENSSYLLRIIARRNEPNKSVDAMLQEELEDILDPLKRFYTSIKSSPEALLLELRNQIQMEAAHSTLLELMDSQASIDIIDLVSKIAWYTKFNVNILGSEQGEQKYRSGLIKPSVIIKFARLTEEQAETFIDICIKLRIMSGTKNAAIWVDHLVPDGSIALRLKQDIVGNVNRYIQEQLIRTLHRSQSLSFLTALMDIPLFDALLESQSTFSIRKLLTAQVSRYLTQYPLTFNSIASSVFNFTENLSESQQEEWLPIIGALYPNSLYIQQHCHEAIVSRRNAGYYLSILFYQCKLEDVSQRYYDIVGSTELAAIALKYGKTEDWVGIVNLILLEYNSYRNSLLNEWKMFLSRSEVSTLPLLIEMILERVFPNGQPSPDFASIGTKLIKEIFEALAEQYKAKPKLYNTLAAQIIKIVDKKVQSLINLYPAFSAEFDIMVKWLAFYHSKQLTNLSATYLLKKDGSENYAIPDICHSIKNNIAAIRDDIFTGFPRFKLARVADLLPNTPLPNELVADGFPPDYNYSPQYALAAYAWKKRGNDGTVQSLTEKERQNNYVLYWRAIFKL